MNGGWLDEALGTIITPRLTHGACRGDDAGSKGFGKFSGRDAMAEAHAAICAGLN